MLDKIFIELTRKYINDEKVYYKLWNEIEKAYTGKKRYYHNLFHLQALYNELTECRQLISDWDTILFSLFYHDIIYSVIKGNNEQKSADVAVNRLKVIGFPELQIERCYQQILATSNHLTSNDLDTNLFTDSDLSILGQPESAYDDYCLQIRKEYGIFPDMIYKPGRKKVVIHFLEMQRIFKTEIFFEKFEMQARKNLQRELEKLIA